jgi:hypothetical protein
MRNSGGSSFALKTRGAWGLGVQPARSFPLVEQVCGSNLPVAQVPIAARERLGSPLPLFRRPSRVAHAVLP